jgi:hypothetical protein
LSAVEPEPALVLVFLLLLPAVLVVLVEVLREPGSYCKRAPVAVTAVAVTEGP